MINNQLTFKDQEIIQILNRVYLRFKEGFFTESVELLKRALDIDNAYPGLGSTMKCAQFWQDSQEKIIHIEDKFEVADYLLSRWKEFSGLIGRMDDISERCVDNIKQFVYSSALKEYNQLYQRTDNPDADVILKIGMCYKAIGNFEKAIDFLEEASQIKSRHPAILAELADCYSMVNEVKASKVFFRESYFIDPQSVEHNTLESPMMRRLVKTIEEKGYLNAELKEWIPVYGTIYRIFDVKRELRPVELGRLKQSIYSLEKELEKHQETPEIIIPRLINRYFWLIDHYTSTKEDRLKIEEVLNNIRKIAPDVYKEYIN